MQQRGSNNQGMQNRQRGPHLREVHTPEVHTSGRSTPLGSTPLYKGNPHQSTESHLRSSSKSYLRCGAHLLLSPHLNSLRPGSLTRGREEAKEKSLARITDLRTVHNLWTRTIAIGLNTLQRLYNCTHPNRAGNGGRRPKPYHMAGVQVSGWYPPASPSLAQPLL
jgi:hypothetical protein